MNSDDDPELHTSPCLMSCLQEFRNMIFPGDRDFDQVCKIISEQYTNTMIVSLYCCDMKCEANPEAGPGHDLNVHQIIKKCKSFGISNIVGPGPPSTSSCSSIFACTSGSISTLTLSTSTSSQVETITPLLTSPFSAPLSPTATSHQTTLMTLNLPTTMPTITRSTTSPSIMAPAAQPIHSQTFWQKLSPNAKIGCILGLTLVILFILLTMLFLIRHKLRSRSLLSRSLSISPELPIQTPPPSPSPASPQISNMRRDYTERARVSRGGGMVGCRSPHIVVMEMEGKNSVDSEGIRWPDEVVLTGEAKEMREWSLGYGLDRGGKMRDRDGEKVSEKRLEYEMGMEKF